ncbi:hypothetical protein PsW64_05055 [Pseudovibrio sp. W64]|uniref:hypothetical protein n=1 Tax=unclassified Pseudovibrio TaxID=2627060 RepID=UPI0007AEDA6D|nr:MULTISPECIES: hypothetical protein [unclassified Pseudovibrio]KZK76331.1 hypothetical protein PsW64_05055 [Pseudovibrio sp. W64]KZK80911.1 hypothetical protein PsAD46_03959 [Pseudovibrio sp. Ad46]KZL01578.1 hypothetical protein PsAD5_00500 [Pseudovibrio sp. Ad5]
MKRKAKFQTEAEMCSVFLKNLPEGWTAYPEWNNWDIVLVRDCDGFQIGIEAKLRLNAKVVTQAAERAYEITKPGPDCRAILIPEGHRNDLAFICGLLNLQIIEVRDEVKSPKYDEWFSPSLPVLDQYNFTYFPEFFPLSRMPLPEIVPTVEAGKPCPTRLTDWKIKAIKLSILLEKNGFVTRKTFKELELSPTLFIYAGKNWMERGSTRGHWQKTGTFPDFRNGFEANYAELEQLFPDWSQQLSL